MLRIVKPGGRVLLYNWAFEQVSRARSIPESSTSNPTTYTVGTKPCTLNPKPCSLQPKP
jgi:hypothetical protein